jgi:hypothetical protein
MGSAERFENEKLVIGVLTGEASLEPALVAALEKHCGPLDFTSPKIAFSFTSYYEKEMGSPLLRWFVSAERLISPDALADIKLMTNALEAEFAAGGRRRINLDPGILSSSRFALASTKNSSHRIPLARGIYAEIELVFEYGVFRPVEWTYPDYRSPEYLAILKSIRDVYRAQLKARETDTP